MSAMLRAMRLGAFIVILVGSVLATACGQGHHTTYSYAQADGGCPGKAGPGFVDGPQPTGGGCDADADCMITCCSCVNHDGRSFAAHACVDNKCNDDQACALASSATLCP